MVSGLPRYMKPVPLVECVEYDRVNVQRALCFIICKAGGGALLPRECHVMQVDFRR